MLTPRGGILAGQEAERHRGRDRRAGAAVEPADGRPGRVAGRVQAGDRRALRIENPTRTPSIRGPPHVPSELARTGIA